MFFYVTWFAMANKIPSAGLWNICLVFILIFNNFKLDMIIKEFRIYS